MSMGAAQRERSEPNRARRRGPSCLPAPGKLSKRKWSGGVRFEELLDLVIKLLENFLEVAQLTHKTFCCEHEGLDQSQVIRNILSLFIC
jgi:hypothetical protein